MAVGRTQNGAPNVGSSRPPETVRREKTQAKGKKKEGAVPPPGVRAVAGEQAHPNVQAWKDRLTRPRDPNGRPLTFHKHLPDATYDGTLLRYGQGGAPLVYDSTKSLGRGLSVIYINGIRNDLMDQRYSLSLIAQKMRLPVTQMVGVRNACEGLFDDRAQTLRDQTYVPVAGERPRSNKAPPIEAFSDLSRVSPEHINPAIATAAETLLAQMRADNPIQVIVHSQGAAIISAALQIVKVFLSGSPAETGLSKQELKTLEQRFTEIKVETYGGAAKAYPIGPQYQHVINVRDPFVQAYGLLAGSPSHKDLQTRAGGPNAIMQFIDIPGARDNLLTTNPEHSFNQTYLPARRPQFGERLPLPESVGIADLRAAGVSPQTARQLVEKYPLMDVLRSEVSQTRLIGLLPIGLKNNQGLEVVVSELKRAGIEATGQADEIVTQLFAEAAAKNPSDPAQGVYSFLEDVERWQWAANNKLEQPNRPEHAMPVVLVNAINRVHNARR